MIIRVFPRQTKATPVDPLARIGVAPSFPDWDEPIDEIHVSVTFSWDLPVAEAIARTWEQYGPVKIGGPATGTRGEGFEPGKYLRPGYVITSRGCPNRCFFCFVWKRDGDIRELPITEGWNVLDDNILATSDAHFLRVIDMLGRQPEAPQFTGGLEAARRREWHAEALRSVRPKQMFFAYDTPDDHEPLVAAGKLLLSKGFTEASHALRAYVLCGYPKDTMEEADKRMHQTLAAGFMPMAMVFRNEKGKKDPRWATFQRLWARPALIASRSQQGL